MRLNDAARAAGSRPPRKTALNDLHDRSATAIGNLDSQAIRAMSVERRVAVIVPEGFARAAFEQGSKTHARHPVCRPGRRQRLCCVKGMGTK
jgi:hypothetical protein